jgi:photosystem II stability/assembly factor-like uncharacterized protein
MTRGVYRTTDSGDGWIPRNTGLGDLQVHAVAVDPADPRVVWACTDTGMYRSTNSGDSWALRGLSGKSVRDVAFDPADGSRAWASVAFEGIYKTTDGGAGWALSSSGIGGSKLFYDIQTGASASRLYAVGWDAYRSTDGGATWIEFGVGFWPSYETVTAIAVRAGDENALLAATFGSGLFRSLDAGLNWSAVGPDTPDLIEYTSIAGHPLDPASVLAGALGGEIYHATSFGADSWELTTTGISTATVLSLDASEGLLLAGTLRGVYLSTNGGFVWEKSDLVYDVGAEINSIAIAPGDGLTAWCGNTNGFFKGDVWRSQDGGRTWNLVKNGDGPVDAIAIDPDDAQRVYAGYACDVAPGGVYRTTNGGTTWITENIGSTCVYALQILPGSPSILIAGTSSGIWRSTDHGDTWTARGLSGISVVDFSLDATIPGRVYAATYGARAHASTDGGQTWSLFGGTALPGFLHCIDGMTPAAGVLAGSETAGIWRYDGATWVRLPDAEQPMADDILAFLGGVAGDRFLAGTRGAGAWDYIPDPAGLESGPVPEMAPLKVDILGSPGNPPFAMTITRGRSGPLRLDVIDAAGRRVDGVAEPDAGPRFAWIWDARGAAPGVYFVRVRSDEGIATSRIVRLTR